MNEPFNDLMAQYSGEAETAKLQEEKAARDQQFQRAVIKNCFRVITLALIGAAFYYMKPITHQLDVLTAKVIPAKPLVSTDQNAKVNQVSQAAASRDQAVDAAMR